MRSRFVFLSTWRYTSLPKMSLMTYTSPLMDKRSPLIVCEDVSNLSHGAGNNEA